MKVITKPDITLYDAILVTKETNLEFHNDNVDQTIKDLKMVSETRVKGEGYSSKYITEVELQEGEKLVFESEGRGYIKPIEEMYTIEEAINELNCLKEE